MKTNIKIIADNAGGVTVQVGDLQWHYIDANDIAEVLYWLATYGTNDLEALGTPLPEFERLTLTAQDLSVGGYRVFGLADVLDHKTEDNQLGYNLAKARALVDLEKL